MGVDTVQTERHLLKIHFFNRQRKSNVIKQETEIMRRIMVECSDIAILWRANVGKFYTKDLRIVNTGLPKGFSDLFGFRLKDQKIIFIKVKTRNY